MAGFIAQSMRVAMREMRGAFRRFTIFLVLIGLGVGAMAAVATLNTSLRAGIDAEAGAILGGDLDVTKGGKPFTGEQLEYFTTHGRTSRILSTRTMASDQDGKSPTLMALKGVDQAYPLYGQVELDPPGELSGALAQTNGTHGAVVQKALLKKLGLGVGDRIKVGDTLYRVNAVLEREPDRAGRFFRLAPTMITSLEGFRTSGVERPGSVIRRSVRIRTMDGMQDLEKVKQDIRSRFMGQGLRVRQVADAGQAMGRFIDNLSQFLTLVGLTSLLVGGIGAGSAVRTWLEGKTMSIATLKCLGASSRLVATAYGLQVAVLALAGSILGIAVGTAGGMTGAMVAASLMKIHAQLSLSAGTVATLMGFGLLTALTFSVVPIARACRTSPASLFRGYVDAGPRPVGAKGWGLLAVCCLALALLTVLTSFNKPVALSFVGAALACILIFRGFAALLRKIAPILARGRGPVVRQAMSGLTRPGAPTTSMVLSLGLGLTAMVTVVLIQANLNAQIRSTIPEIAPSFFFMGIPKNSLDEYRRTAMAIPGVDRIEAAPTVRGRIIRLNGKPAREENVPPEVSWAIRSERALTFAQDMPDKVKLVDGQWWPKDYAGAPLICLDHDLAQGFGLTPGDTMTVNVMGRPITATIAATRKIDWSTVELNHSIIFAPGALEKAPYTWLSTAYTDTPEAEEALFAEVMARYPFAVAIRVGEVIEDVAEVLDNIGTAVALAASLTLVCGLIVLGQSVRVGLTSRHYDSVVFKVLGAGRSTVLAIQVLEFSTLAMSCAALAAGLGTLGSWLFMLLAPQLKWSFAPLPALAVTFCGAAAALALGLLGVRRALARPAWTVLRND